MTMITKYLVFYVAFIVASVSVSRYKCHSLQPNTDSDTFKLAEDRDAGCWRHLTTGAGGRD